MTKQAEFRRIIRAFQSISRDKCLAFLAEIVSFQKIAAILGITLIDVRPVVSEMNLCLLIKAIA